MKGNNTMKTMKKLCALVVAVVMVLAMAVTTFAADTTITAPDDGHTYKAYQIFTGDLADGKLSNLAWGSAAKDSTADIDTAVTELTAVNSGTDKEKLAVIEQYVNLAGTATTIAAGATVTVPTGYYLIVDDSYTDTEAAESYSLNVVQIVGPTTIKPKRDVPEFKKEIKDTNDTTGETSDWQDSADYDLGDAVPFKLTGKVASDYANYSTYYFAFHDVEEAGLTFNADSVKVYIDNVEVTSGYQLVTNPSDGCTFEVVFAELKNTSATAGSTITVEYTSTLNENAVMGDAGNVNKAKLQFSNNPNNTQTGSNQPTDETPWDNVIVFTYNVVINKVDENKQALPGAEFTLTKKLADGSTKTVAVVKNDAGTSFTFNRLDDGEYTLTETVTPAGYNTISPISFKVEANHTITWDGTNRNDVLTTLSGTKTTGEITLTATKADGKLSADVENKSGSVLPTTGGMGTTIIYIVGAILVLGAGVLLITRRRVAK